MFKRFVFMDDKPGAAGGGDGGATPPAGGATPPAGAAPAGATPPAGAKPADGGAPPAGDAKPAWPDNWRTLVAGDDEKVAKQLDRFTDPKAVVTAYRALQQKLSSGEYVSKLPADAKPEDVTKWRKENGIPEDVKGYEMPEGLVVGDADKPLIDAMLGSMHAKNLPKDAVKGIVADYYKQQEALAAQRAEQDADNDTAAKETLIAEWGGDYKRNANAIKSLLETAPDGIKDKIMGARLADGKAAVHDPDFMRWLAQLSREINPVASVVPAGADQATAIADELAGLVKQMGDRNSDYWKGPLAERKQARYRELIDAQSRAKK